MAKVMLPKEIDPIQLAESRKKIKGELPLEEMERLKELICQNSGKALIDLSFGRDLLGYLYIQGSINAAFKVICQRCNAPMQMNLDIAVKVSPVLSDEEAEKLPKGYDPLLLTGDTISLITMVEEEILLGIPIVPKHSLKECKVKSSELQEFEEEEEKPNPFRDLKKLLRE